MKLNKKTHVLYATMPMIMVLILLLFLARGSFAADPIKLIVDGKDITVSGTPIFQNGRTLVPLRLVSDELGATVQWQAADRSVRVNKGDHGVLLRIDSYLVTNTDQVTSYSLCDVAPQIIDQRTYVPLRLVSNALGVAIQWQESSRTVTIDSTQPAAIKPFFDMKILALQPNQVISGGRELQVSFPTQLPAGAVEIKYLLLNTETGRGTVIARGDQLSAAYQWLPDLKDTGSRILVAAVFDLNGHFLAGDAVPVQMALVPQAALTGLIDGQTINTGVSLGAVCNFSAHDVKYVVTNLDNNKVFVSPEADPQGPYQWTPMMEYNGNLAIKVVAYDQEGQGYESPAVLVKAETVRKISLAGVTAGKTITRPVTLSTVRNFQVIGTEYLMLDPQSGKETILAKVGYGSYKWFPGPELKGTRQLLVRLTNTKGEIFTSSPTSVNLQGIPMLFLEGVGPQQVIADTVKLKANSNAVLQSIKYSMINTITGAKKVIAAGQVPGGEFAYTPLPGDGGSWKIQAEGTLDSGKKIVSEAIPVTIYTGKIYTPVPIIEKSKFQAMASALAENSWQKTGMSAALQTAQAILETGWGQSVPVDKYNGQISYNLFGIKGSGPAGSVISNTWEEYNGTAFRIDAKFRAYHSATESWSDHKQLLLTASRYKIFRDVMHDSTQGAWALKRAGYATDAKYPLKLMEIINRYNLQALDRTGI